MKHIDYQTPIVPNAVHEVELLNAYVRGLNKTDPSDELSRVAYWLDYIGDHICGQGYVDCAGGRDCTSDHK